MAYPEILISLISNLREISDVAFDKNGCFVLRSIIASPYPPTDIITSPNDGWSCSIATPEELEMIVSELIEHNLHDIASHQLGSAFFKHLACKLNELEKNKDLSAQNLSILILLMINSLKLKSMIIDSPTFGMDSLFVLLEFSEFMKPELVLTLKNGDFLEIFSQSTKIDHFLGKLFQHLSLSQLEPLLIMTAKNVNSLSSQPVGLANLKTFLKLATPHISMAGRMLSFPMHKYANYLIRSAVAHASDETAFVVMEELAPGLSQ